MRFDGKVFVVTGGTGGLGGDINAIAEELLAAAVMPGGSFLTALMDSIEAGKALEGAASPSESTVDFFRGDPADFAPPAAGPMVPGPGFPAPVDPDAEVAAWLASPGAQAMFAVGPGVSQLTSGGTTIIINATAVTGQEVVDAMGAYVDTNGPLPPHWQQSAN